MKRRALISVYDKNGIVDFAKTLIRHGWEIISTSGTSTLLVDNGIKIIPIEQVTSQPEILGGRVKTLHPIIFAAILADRRSNEHSDHLRSESIQPIDLVVVNLYPFAKTISDPACTTDEAIEQIDIGGVSLIRAAAKNFSNVSVIVNPAQYKAFSEYIEGDKKDISFKLKLARDAFEYVSEYDSCISEYFEGLFSGSDASISQPAEKEPGKRLTLRYPFSQSLRYGENPHQQARLYLKEKSNFNDIFEILHGRELSFNNLLDISAAFKLIGEFAETTCVIVKHTNPCGTASDPNLSTAYRKALATDSVSAFGGIVIVNARLDTGTAKEIDKIFTEIIIARDFESNALELLMNKKNRRLIKYHPGSGQNSLELRSITGGLLAQEPDETLVDENSVRCVTERKPDDSEYRDLLFAMKIAKHTKSNSVVYVKNLQTLGIGGGQPSRLDSSDLAVEKARRFKLDLKGSAVASDAFFPFADGVITAAKAGAASVIQPGGSVRDEEVIRAANENGMAMLFTGIRHFKH